MFSLFLCIFFQYFTWHIKYHSTTFRNANHLVFDQHLWCTFNYEDATSIWICSIVFVFVFQCSIVVELFHKFRYFFLSIFFVARTKVKRFDYAATAGRGIVFFNWFDISQLWTCWKYQQWIRYDKWSYRSIGLVFIPIEIATKFTIYYGKCTRSMWSTMLWQRFL